MIDSIRPVIMILLALTPLWFWILVAYLDTDKNAVKISFNTFYKSYIYGNNALRWARSTYFDGTIDKSNLVVFDRYTNLAKRCRFNYIDYILFEIFWYMTMRKKRKQKEHEYESAILKENKNGH